MATAIDDRQELLEQFQAVSPFVSFVSASSQWTIYEAIGCDTLVTMAFRWCSIALLRATPASYRSPVLSACFRGKPTLVGTTPGVAALQSALLFLRHALFKFEAVEFATCRHVLFYLPPSRNETWLMPHYYSHPWLISNATDGILRVTNESVNVYGRTWIIAQLALEDTFPRARLNYNNRGGIKRAYISAWLHA